MQPIYGYNSIIVQIKFLSTFKPNYLSHSLVNNQLLLSFMRMQTRKYSNYSLEVLSQPVAFLWCFNKILIMVKNNYKVKMLDKETFKERLRGSFKRFVQLSARELISISVWRWKLSIFINKLLHAHTTVKIFLKEMKKYWTFILTSFAAWKMLLITYIG